MKLSQHTRDQRAVQTKDFPWGTGAKEGQGDHIVDYVDYLEKGKTINGEYYVNLLDPSAFGEEKIFFHQDNTSMYTCVIPMTKFHELGYELLPHPPRQI